MNKKHVLVSILTIGSLIPLLYFRSVGFATSIFWVYSITMTTWMLTMHITTRTYKPMPDVGHRPSVAVVVPAKNEEEHIVETVNAILNSDYPQDKLEIVVVDDGSTDRTAEHVLSIKSRRVKLLSLDRNYGKRVAFASGVEKTTSKIIVCIDSDTIVDINAIKMLVQPFSKRNIVAVCGHGKAKNYNKNLLTKLQHWWYQDMFRLIKGMESRFGAVTCCSGILAAYRRESIMPLLDTWLNERFLGRKILIGDDRQLTNLVLWKGLLILLRSTAEDRILTSVAYSVKNAEVVYQSNSLAYTYVPETSKQFFRQQLRWKRAWVHGSILASQFMWRKKFPVPLLFYMYQFLTYISPIVIVTWLIVKPLSGDLFGSFLFLIGTLYIGILQGLNVWVFMDSPFAPTVFYRTIFVFMSFFLSLTILLYAWSTPWKGGWVTREDTRKSLLPSSIVKLTPEHSQRPSSSARTVTTRL